MDITKTKDHLSLMIHEYLSDSLGAEGGWTVTALKGNTIRVNRVINNKIVSSFMVKVTEDA